MTPFFKGLARRYVDHRVSRSAAELSYYILFALFPMLVFVSILLGRLNVPQSQFFDRLSFLLPERIVSLARDYLSYAGSISETNRLYFLYAGSVLAVYMLFKALISLNYSVRKALDVSLSKRPAKAAATLLSALLLLLVIAVLLSVLSVSDNLFNAVSAVLNINIDFIFNLARFGIGPALIFGLLRIYYFLISDTRYKRKGCVAGAAVATALSYASSVLFAIYFNDFSDIGVLYGSLGSFMLLLMWIHLVGTILIMGAEVMAQINAGE